MSDSRDQENLHLEQVMKTVHGRAVLKRILDQTGLDHSTFDAEPYLHAYNAGKRDIGVWLNEELKTVVPELHSIMMKEQNGR